MRRVLIVDDDEGMRRLLRLSLSFGDFEICSAPNGEVALEKVEQQDIDAIVVDYQMPVMDGGTFVQEARARGIETPIIMLSAWPQARLVSGTDAFVSKPFDPEELLRIVTEKTHAA